MRMLITSQDRYGQDFVSKVLGKIKKYLWVFIVFAWIHDTCEYLKRKK